MSCLFFFFKKLSFFFSRYSYHVSCSVIQVWVQSSVISNVHARVIVICSGLTHSWIPSLFVACLNTSVLLPCCLCSVDGALTESGNCPDVWNVWYSSARCTTESRRGTRASISPEVPDECVVFLQRNSNTDFDVLDAKIASALNRIIHNTHFKKKFSLEEMKAQKEDRFLRGRQIAHLIYEYFRVTGANDSVENYADLFTIALRNDDIQEFDSKWDGILLSMTKIPSDDILEGLYKLRKRESEKLKTVSEVYNMEIHQQKAESDYHRLKTMVERSIEP